MIDHIAVGEPVRAATRNKGASPPRVRREMARGWTKAKREHFLSRLAETGNVLLSMSDSGMSHGSLYQLRKRSAEFSEAWDAALDLGYARIEAMLLDRALNGRRRVFREGVIVDEFVECSDGLALSLLAQHRKRVVEHRVAVTAQTENPERLRERFMVKLQRLARAAGWLG
ncbi:hypothetical protein BH09PSE3_BH09PSE3_00970 [soil metagenome]